MIKAKNGIWQFTAQDFNNLILYFGLDVNDVIVSPSYNSINADSKSIYEFVRYSFVNKHTWKEIFSITDHSDYVNIQTNISWFNKGDKIELVTILGEPEYWTKLFVKELFNV